jgi:hypothetical protein
MRHKEVFFESEFTLGVGIWIRPMEFLNFWYSPCCWSDSSYFCVQALSFCAASKPN